MPRLQVTLTPRSEEPVVPADVAFEATVTNESTEPVVLNRSQAARPSLVLEVEDEEGASIALPPPPPPTKADLEAGDPLDPGESATFEYGGFLDRSLPAGTYRVRYAGYHPPLGGTKDEPLSSDWTTVTVVEASNVAPEARPLHVRGGLDRPVFVVRWIRDLLHALVCIILRLFGRLRCDRTLTREVDEARTETISNAPAGAEAWNGTYGWRARFQTRVDQANCRVIATIRIRLQGAITQAQRVAWETAIENAWTDRFKLCCRCCCCRDGYRIAVDVQFVESGEHHVVTVGNTTTNMTNWGRNDTVDVSHEVGHMLGALDEYFTVDGINWGAGRQPDGSIMNNPANPPAARHYDLVRESAQDLLGTRCRTIPVAHSC